MDKGQVKVVVETVLAHLRSNKSVENTRDLAMIEKELKGVPSRPGYPQGHTRTFWGVNDISSPRVQTIPLNRLNRKLSSSCGRK